MMRSLAIYEEHVGLFPYSGGYLCPSFGRIYPKNCIHQGFFAEVPKFDHRLNGVKGTATHSGRSNHVVCQITTGRIVDRVQVATDAIHARQEEFNAEVVVG